jgi:hypothetical protein
MSWLNDLAPQMNDENIDHSFPENQFLVIIIRP